MRLPRLPFHNLDVHIAWPLLLLNHCFSYDKGVIEGQKTGCACITLALVRFNERCPATLWLLILPTPGYCITYCQRWPQKAAQPAFAFLLGCSSIILSGGVIEVHGSCFSARRAIALNSFPVICFPQDFLTSCGKCHLPHLSQWVCRTPAFI